MRDEVAQLPLALLLEPVSVLRLVNRDSVEFLELRDSLQAHGFLNSISVRPATKRAGYYEIIDGLCRYTAAKELSIDVVPCIIKHGVTDDDVLALQLQANAVGMETTPVEFAQRMKLLLTRRPEMSIRELSCLIRKGPTWIGENLGLLKLTREMQTIVNRGEMPVQSAYMLAKIPHSLQRQYVEQARKLPAREFKAVAAAVIKQFTEAIKAGKMEAFYVQQFKPQAHLRPLKVIDAELTRREVGGLVVAGEECRTALDGFYAGLRWCCHLDRQSVREQETAVRGREERQVTDDDALE